MHDKNNERERDFAEPSGIAGVVRAHALPLDRGFNPIRGTEGHFCEAKQAYHPPKRPPVLHINIKGPQARSSHA